MNQFQLKSSQSWQVHFKSRTCTLNGRGLARDEPSMHFCSNNTPIIKCAQCGEQLIVPEWSEYIDEYRVRHVWKCEPCHYSFEATIASRRVR